MENSILVNIVRKFGLKKFSVARDIGVLKENATKF